MFDMGFADDIEAILKACPRERQTVLFSATMPPKIDKMSRRHLTDPVRIAIEREKAAAGEAPRVAPGRARRRPGPQAGRPGPGARHGVARRGAGVLPDPRGGRRAHRAAEDPRLPRRAAARRDEPGAARPGDAAAAWRYRRPADRHRRRRPRARRRPPDPRRQLQRAVSAPEAYVHRIGRVGRAGREGVAITLPSRASSGCSRRSSGSWAARSRSRRCRQLPTCRPADSALDPHGAGRAARLGRPERGRGPGPRAAPQSTTRPGSPMAAALLAHRDAEPGRRGDPRAGAGAGIPRGRAPPRDPTPSKRGGRQAREGPAVHRCRPLDRRPASGPGGRHLQRVRPQGQGHRRRSRSPSASRWSRSPRSGIDDVIKALRLQRDQGPQGPRSAETATPRHAARRRARIPS